MQLDGHRTGSHMKYSCRPVTGITWVEVREKDVVFECQAGGTAHSSFSD